MTSTTPTKPFGGYALKGYRTAGGEETIRFEATLTLDGKAIAKVSNGGTGGSNRYDFYTDRNGKTADDFRAFASTATDARYEPEDALIEELATAFTLNRSRCVLFVLDGDDFPTTGVHRRFGSAVTFDQALVALAGPEFAGKNPAVWVKTDSAFVPLADLTK